MSELAHARDGTVCGGWEGLSATSAEGRSSPERTAGSATDRRAAGLAHLAVQSPHDADACEHPSGRRIARPTAQVAASSKVTSLRPSGSTIASSKRRFQDNAFQPQPNKTGTQVI